MNRIIIKGGEIYPIISDKFCGDIYVEDGRITGIYARGQEIPDFDGAITYDVSGCCVIPGLIDAHTHLGIFEECTGKIGQDNNETSYPVTPEIRGLDGINPNDIGFTDALRAGVRIAIMTDHPYNSVDQLRIVAILACRQGLPQNIALQAITINPASMLRIDDRVGTLERGKDADIVVLDGPPLDINAHVKMVFVEGKLAFNADSDL